MLQGKLQSLHRSFMTASSSLQGTGGIGLLCLFNLGLILLLGAILGRLSSQIELFLVTLVMTATAGGMVIVLLVKYQRLNLMTQQQQIESTAYDKNPTPLLILTPDLYFRYGNQKAREDCWWAESLPFLRKVMATQESRAILEVLAASLFHGEERIETLTLRGGQGEELWRIHTLPMGKKALWKCENVTHERNEKSKYLGKIKTLTLFLDHATEGLFSLNERGIILFCNEKFASWLGFKRDEIVGHPLSKFLVKNGNSDPIKLSEIQGKCDFITASSRIKSALLEQSKIPLEEGFITYSRVALHTPFASETEFGKVLEMTPLPVVCLDEAGIIQDSNMLFRENFAPDPLALQGSSFINLVAEFQRDEVKTVFESFIKNREEGAPLEIHFNNAKKNIVSAYIASLPLKHQKGLFIQFHDITEQKNFESQLIQSQKMQAVGQLAGGIAHDFNNLLTAMLGFCDLLLLRYSPGDQSFTDIMQIKQNATRAANLVRQLLVFSRKQTLEPKILDVAECLTELRNMLQRLIGPNVTLNMTHARDLGLILVDQVQFEQVIINLAVNAKDAMGDKGVILITTQNCELKKAKRFGHDVIPAGTYVLIEVIDHGMGISPDHIDRIFDPFFSTKAVGSGTGLGLSTAYGIVKQTGGFIQVNSKVNEGTTFSIYLPRYMGDRKALLESQKKEKAQPQDLTGSSTILLVEDEDAVRVFSARALRSKGYKVLEAPNGIAALDLMKSNEETVDLVISDVVMPEMDGPTFVKELSQMNLRPKVLFISGYTEETFHDTLKNNPNIQFLAKPFSLSDLAIRVKDILKVEKATLRVVS